MSVVDNAPIDVRNKTRQKWNGTLDNNNSSEVFLDYSYVFGLSILKKFVKVG